jgi:hypothetical protein
MRIEVENSEYSENTRYNTPRDLLLSMEYGFTILLLGAHNTHKTQNTRIGPGIGHAPIPYGYSQYSELSA